VEAVGNYRAAQTGYTRETNPLNWAITQNGLGVALETLGERAADELQLQEAVTAGSSHSLILRRDVGVRFFVCP
jgi:hypothetical protein